LRPSASSVGPPFCMRCATPRHHREVSGRIVIWHHVRNVSVSVHLAQRPIARPNLQARSVIAARAGATPIELTSGGGQSWPARTGSSSDAGRDSRSATSRLSPAADETSPIVFTYRANCTAGPVTGKRRQGGRCFSRPTSRRGLSRAYAPCPTVQLPRWARTASQGRWPREGSPPRHRGK